MLRGFDKDSSLLYIMYYSFRIEFTTPSFSKIDGPPIEEAPDREAGPEREEGEEAFEKAFGLNLKAIYLNSLWYWPMTRCFDCSLQRRHLRWMRMALRVSSSREMRLTRRTLRMTLW